MTDFGMGNLIDQDCVRFVPTLKAGAQQNGLTIRIPEGQTGNNSILMNYWREDFKSRAGETIKVVQVYPTPEGFTSLPNKVKRTAVLLNGTVDYRDPAPEDYTIDTSDPTVIVVTTQFDLVGDECEIAIGPMLEGLAPLTATEELTQSGFFPEQLTNSAPGQSVGDRNLDRRDRKFMDAPLVQRYGTDLKSSIYQEVVTVSPGGGADFRLVSEAAAAIQDSAAGKYYKIDWHGFIEEEAEIDLRRGYIDLVGHGPGTSRIDFFMPETSSDADIDKYSGILTKGSASLIGGMIRTLNTRYGWHPESDGHELYANLIWRFANFRIFHLGMSKASYQGPRGPQTRNAVGSGNSSGAFFLGEDFWLEAAQGAAFAIHNNGGFTDPGMVLLRRGTLNPGIASGRALSVGAYGSMQADRVVTENVAINGEVAIGTSSWKPTDVRQMPADHKEIRVFMCGNTPHVTRVNDAGEALRIVSATDGLASAVEVAGSAVAALFGDTEEARHFTRTASPGLPGAVWGWGDVGSAIGKSMGERLGDCTATARTLTVTIDGGPPIDIVFSGDHRADSNATILATINIALGTAAIADTFQPGALYRPHVADEEECPRNNTATAIKRRAVLAYDGDRQSVRLMEATDDRDLFAGIAIKDIPAGQRGRVKCGGYLPLEDIETTETELAFNATMSVGAVPGAVVAGGTQGLLRAIGSDAVCVK